MDFPNRLLSKRALFTLQQCIEAGSSASHPLTLHDTLAEPVCDLDKIEKILSTADVNLHNKEGYLPLHVALLNPDCKPDVIRLLISRGASVHAENYLRETSLHVAVQNSNCKPEVIKILLNKEANVKARDIDSNTPLHDAARNLKYKLSVINILLNAGSSLHARNVFRDTPLLTVLKNPNCSIDIVKLLIHRNIVSHLNFEGLTPLQIYFLNPNRNVEVVRELLDNGSPISVRYAYDSSTILHSVVKTSNCYDILSELVSKICTANVITDKVDINSVDNKQNTPLHLALEYNYTDPKVISLLLEHGANPNLANKKNERPLHKALQHFNYNLDIIKELIDYRAIICESTQEIGSPLGFLIKKYKANPTYYRPCVELLLKYAIKNCFEDHEIIEPNFQGYNLDISLCPDVMYTEYGENLSKFIDDCCHELVRMKTDLLTERFSLYDLISNKKCRSWDCASKNILIILTYNNYPIYNDIIVKHLDEVELLAKLQELQIYFNYVSKDNSEKGKQVVLVAECLNNLAKYLCKMDLLSLIIAFYEPVNCSTSKLQDPVDKSNMETCECNFIKRSLEDDECDYAKRTKI